MDLYLDPEETKFLTDLLERRIEDLRREINHTDNRAFKAGLKEESTLMEGLLGKLKMPAPMGI